MGMVAPALAHKVAMDRVARYQANPKYANKPQKIAAWVTLANTFVQADAPAKPKPTPKAKPKAKAKPQPQVVDAPAFTQANVAKFTKATVRDLIASRRILTKAEKAGIAAFLERI
jgi:hypothetical protein